MNLATDPWVPIVRMDGAYDRLSLGNLFDGGQLIADLAVRPHERVALMRLLICLAQAALNGPEDLDEWEETPERLPGAARRYLEKWAEVFDLFHPKRPFLQVAELAPTGNAPPTTVGKLDFALASGNSSTLFDQQANRGAGEHRTFPPDTMALMLLTFLNFSPGGLIAQVEWAGSRTSKYSKDAPCIPSSMYHSFVRAADLKDSLCANLLTKRRVREAYGEEKWGRPVWERMPVVADDLDAIANATGTYLGRLVPLTRVVRLSPTGETMLLGAGLPYPVYPAFKREPTATEVADGDKRRLLGAGRKAIWRELPALTIKRRADDTGGCLTLENVPENVAYDLYVGALIRKSGQADVLDTVESVLHIPVGAQTDTGRAVYEKEVVYCEKVGNRLGQAVETYRKNVDGSWAERVKSARDKWELRRKLHSKATLHFWTAVEMLRPLLMELVAKLGGEPEATKAARDMWRKAVRAEAVRAFELACGRETARQVRAFALGWGVLFGRTGTGVSGTSDIDTTETTEEVS